MKRLVIITCLLLGSHVAGAADQQQIDWAGGPGAMPGNWSNTFANSDNIAWRSKPGRISLGSVITDKRAQEIIAASADIPADIAVGDLDGDGVDDLVVTRPKIDPFNPVGALYWYKRNVNGS